MKTRPIQDQLQDIATDVDFRHASKQLVASWISADVGVEAVEPIFRFLEAKPGLDYGAPGPLVHFVERFYRRGYEQALVDSIRRQPTPHTVWMLNRVINGAETTEIRKSYILELERAAEHALVNEDTAREIEYFLDRVKSQAYR